MNAHATQRSALPCADILMCSEITCGRSVQLWRLAFKSIVRVLGCHSLGRSRRSSTIPSARLTLHATVCLVSAFSLDAINNARLRLCRTASRTALLLRAHFYANQIVARSFRISHVVLDAERAHYESDNSIIAVRSSVRTDRSHLHFLINHIHHAHIYDMTRTKSTGEVSQN